MLQTVECDSAIVRQLMRPHGIRPLPSSFQIIVHANWDTERGASDITPVVCNTLADRAQHDIELHLFNWTGENTSGYHYDALAKLS